MVTRSIIFNLVMMHILKGALMCLTCDSYPKIEFYHTDGVRTMMVDILFIFAKLKPETSYRQVDDGIVFRNGTHYALR